MAQDQILAGIAKIFAAEGAEFPGQGKTGPGLDNGSNPRPLPSSGPVGWKSRPAYQPGDAPYAGDWRKLAFIPPLALYNDAAQWINRLQFLRPDGDLYTPNSLPPLRAQYFTPKPIAVHSVAAGALNLQLQLGFTVNQAAQLSNSASNYFGS